MMQVRSLTFALALVALASPQAAGQDRALVLENQMPTEVGYVRVPAAQTLEWQAFTLEAWITPTGPGVGSGRSTIAGMGVEGGSGPWLSSYQLAWQPNGLLYAQVSPTLGAVGVETTSLLPFVPAGAATYVALTYDGSELRLYVEGQLSNQVPAPGPPMTYADHDLLIGASNFAGAPERLHAIVDEVRFWNTALGPGSIAVHAQCDVEINAPNLVARWSFDGESATDTTGHGLDGTLVGTAWSFGSDQAPLPPPCSPFGGNYCTPAVPNSSGLSGTISAYGSPVAGANDLVLVAEQLPPGEFGYFLGSMTDGFFQPPGSNGNICLSGNIGRFNAPADIGPGPALSIRVDLSSIPVNPPTAGAPGDVWFFQCWYRDGATSNFTDGIAMTLQ
ncbi:MAG: LamG domain-containing protein [bacterium]|nr:LamG domain-containing protein [bacterium]